MDILRLQSIGEYGRQNLYCRGNGLEVGALDKPFMFKFSKMKYADVSNVEQLKQGIKDLNISGLYKKSYIKSDFLMQFPKFDLPQISSESFDFVYSSHSLEHSKNPIFAIAEYLRIVKKNGIIYTIIPNRKFTWEFNRPTTNAHSIIRKFEENIFHYTKQEAEEIIKFHGGHSLYKTMQKKDIDFITKDNLGRHHYHTFDDSNILKIIDYICFTLDCKCIYLNLEPEIHFVLKKY